ncbi:2OG-Fe(II) oxygenase [Sphingomonas sp.]|uniref:2OG-Fe(II) oxygenase n=1 Tax=Sphingomonas sp. TaxID=28214 RepID=UPI0035BBA3E5
MTKMLMPGDPAPYFHAEALGGNPRYAFDIAAGRAVLMLFLGSAAWAQAGVALATVARHRALFDDLTANMFGVSIDPADVAEARIAQDLPGIRWFVDSDRAVSTLYGAMSDDVQGRRQYHPHWVVLDPMLRVVSTHPLADGEAAIAALAALAADPGEPPAAPVLVVPRIFEPALCDRLIAYYEERGGVESGFMREENGVTVLKTDHDHKRRADCIVEDKTLLDDIRARLTRFLKPQIKRAFQFDATRVERWLVACYDGEDAGGGGHFRAHRDNTTKGTAHRKFACTINLNAGDYDGGDLRFPEFGARTYRAPTGGAVIFSCSLLHEATRVTRGKRYAFLPFFYDEDGAKLRERNLAFVSPELASYRAGTGA